MMELPIWLIILFMIAIIAFIKVADSRIKRLESQLYKYRKFEKSEAFELYEERERQIYEEGYNVHTDKVNYNFGELVGASAGYIESYLNNINNVNKEQQFFIFYRNAITKAPVYPWTEDKREQTPQRRKLIKAGALILAELDRIK